MMACNRQFPPRAAFAKGLVLAAVVLLGACGTGGSNDRSTQAPGEAPIPQATTTASPPPLEQTEGPADEPAQPEADLQTQRDAPGSGALPYTEPATEAPRAAAPTRPPPAPAERRIAKKSEVYDPSGSDFDLLQAPREALRDLPIDANGKVDWVRALEQGLIAPRASLSGSANMQVLDKDIIMKNTRDMPWVRFPHRQHTEWLACSNCHPRPFAEQAGANPVSMDEIFRGEYCGMCHDRVAFSVFLCERCHTEPHPGAPNRWW